LPCHVREIRHTYTYSLGTSHHDPIRQREEARAPQTVEGNPDGGAAKMPSKAAASDDLSAGSPRVCGELIFGLGNVNIGRVRDHQWDTSGAMTDESAVRSQSGANQTPCVRDRLDVHG